MTLLQNIIFTIDFQNISNWYVEFARPKESNLKIKGLYDLSKFTFDKAVQELQNQRFMTNYGEFYGRKPAIGDLSDTSVLKSQKFSQLEWWRIIKDKIKDILDVWQSLQKEDYFLGVVISVLRSLFTFVKNTEPDNSTNRTLHKKFKLSEVGKIERYDKLMLKISQKINKDLPITKLNNLYEK